LAISRHGRGALVDVTDASADGLLLTVPVSFTGVADHGPVAAAHWDADGLMLTTTTGMTVECQGNPLAGRWHCSPIPGPALPFGSFASRGGVAVARGVHGLRAAVVGPGEDTVMFLSKADQDSSWLPAGEVRVPTSLSSSNMATFAGSEALLLGSADGAVARLGMTDGRVTKSAHLLDGDAVHTRACCLLHDGRLARLVRSVSEKTAFELFLQ